MKIIGQKQLQETIETIGAKTYPRFSIIQGGRGAGKTIIAKSIATLLEGVPVIVDGKVDSIREVIDLAYKQSEPTVYIIPHADKISLSAKNALLKITEEPPKKAYFIMCLEDLANTLPTLTSRGTVFKLDIYSLADLVNYAENVLSYEVSQEEMDIIGHVCTTPIEVKQLIEYGILDFYNYVVKVVNNITTVNGANAFKIGSKISFKVDDGLWNMELFLKAVMNVYATLLFEHTENTSRYLDSIKTSGKYLRECRIKGVNKQSTFDMWILDIRKIWR